MDTKSVWVTLSNIPVGTIIAWIMVIVSITLIVSKIVKALFKTFSKYKEEKDDYSEQKQVLKKHGEVLSQIDESLKQIHVSINEQKEVNYKQTKSSIVEICTSSIKAGNISVERLKSVEELFEVYVNIFHGNGYVRTLMNKVRELPVIKTVEE